MPARFIDRPFGGEPPIRYENDKQHPRYPNPGKAAGRSLTGGGAHAPDGDSPAASR